MLLDFSRLSSEIGKKSSATAIYLKMPLSSVGQDFTEAGSWEQAEIAS